MREFTASSPYPKKVIQRLQCELVHSTVPFFTGKYVYSKGLKKKIKEIIWVCKEGCDKK